MKFNSNRIALYFKDECGDLTKLYLTDDEVDEWLRELQAMINDESKSPQQRLQKLIDEINATW